MGICDLIGKTLLSVDVNNTDEIRFMCNDGTVYIMYHYQECCESVNIEDVTGDIRDLVGVPVIRAEGKENSDNPKTGDESCDDSHTWTFYTIATIKGWVDIRWYGSSNGYYSESVTFEEED